MNTATGHNTDALDAPGRVIAEAIDYLVAHHAEQPDLDFLARRAGYEKTYFQKLFRERVGISPKRLAQYMNVRRARELLAGGGTTLFAAQEAGLSGAGRLYDLFVSCEAVTPGDISHKGRGLDIVYGFHPTPLGEIMVAQTSRGVCFLGFLVDASREEPRARLRAHFPLARLAENPAATAEAAARIMRIWACGARAGEKKLALDLHGTNMQIQVWQALLKIPCGSTVTYKDIACDIGRPRASRAVGNAVGANPVSLLIPCHRVIRASGIIDNYGWGSARKKLILAAEGALPA
jgi:AraC family transcriptional regulator of adaptative response/methylated-DNA-[protein]-cysteine methyltransferase